MKLSMKLLMLITMPILMVSFLAKAQGESSLKEVALSVGADGLIVQTTKSATRLEEGSLGDNVDGHYVYQAVERTHSSGDARFLDVSGVDLEAHFNGDMKTDDALLTIDELNGDGRGMGQSHVSVACEKQTEAIVCQTYLANQHKLILTIAR